MAVTLTYSDQGVYHRVISTGSGTFTDDDIYQQLYSDAGGAETYMTRTGSPGSYVYTMKLQAGDNHLQVYVSAGTTWQREEGATFGWEWSASSTTYYILYNYGTIILADNCVFDGNANSAAYARGYMFHYGNITGTQSLGNEAIFENCRSSYFVCLYTNLFDLDYVIFRNTTFSTGYLMYFYGATTTSWKGNSLAHSFKHITVSDDGGEGVLVFNSGDYSKWVIEDWTIDNLEEIWFYDNSALKFVRTEFKNNDDWTRSYNNGYMLAGSQYNTSRTKIWDSNKNHQPMMVYDTCTFDAMDNGVWNNLLYTGGVALFKDCTFDNATYGIGAYGHTVLLYGDNDFTGVTTAKNWSAEGTFLHVRKLNLTVNDSGGSPLENASVHVRTKLTKTVDGRDHPYEEFNFLTDENGQVKGMVEDSIYLTEKEETSAGSFTQWSDGTGSNVHIITISHPDYAVDTREVAMTQDRTIVAQLSTLEPDQTRIYDSTLYDSTIY